MHKCACGYKSINGICFEKDCTTNSKFISNLDLLIILDLFLILRITLTPINFSFKF